MGAGTRVTMRTILKLAAGWMVLAVVALAADELATVHFLVLKDHNGKPVRNCSVIMHPVSKSGKLSRAGIQLKTDADGKTSYDGVPYGKLAIQVLAQGYQTTGETYEINKREMEITIRIKRPAEQFTIYGDNKGDDKKAAPGEQKKGDKPQ
jgi:hypothetical protein